MVRELCAILLGVLLGISATMVYIGPTTPESAPADPNKPKETILHYHVLDKSMCKWPA